MKIAICDDEMPMRAMLRRSLEAYAQQRKIIILCTEFRNGSDLLRNPDGYDMIFMDYQMPDIDGLETAKALRRQNIDTPIIFLTSYQHIVFDTFAVNAYRFLVKPIDAEKLAEAMDHYLLDQSNDQYLIIKDGDTNRRLRLEDVIYAEASDKYCYIRTMEEGILYRQTLSELESMLPQDRFFRSHRAYLIGFRHIISHTETEVTFDNQEKALISKTKRTPFRNAFQDYIKRYHFAER